MNEADFLRVIVADPDDDAVRLAYCDWLEEHADVTGTALERAEFIRGQVELARDPRDSLPRRRLAFRVRELLDHHEGEWLGPVGAHFHDRHFHRGFLDKVGVWADTLLRLAQPLFASAPLRRLWVTGLCGDLAPLSHIPQGHTLTSLDLCYNQLSSAALEQLTTLPVLGALRTLGLMFNAIDDEGARLLRRHPAFQGLSLIRCGANPISEAAREELQQHFGERVSFVCERDDDHLYAIQDDYGFTAGFGQGYTQLLFRTWEPGVRVAVFDHEGSLLDVWRRDVALGEGDPWEQRDAAKQDWMEELGFRSATIRVKRFTFEDGEGIHGFNWWQEAFDDPNHPQPEVRDSVGHWLRTGMFEWDFVGDNYWLDGKGRVRAT